MPQKNNKDLNNQQAVLEQEGRVPPQAIEVEEAILGAMLIENGAATEAIQMLSPVHFYKSANRHIYEVFKHLFDNNIPIDLISVENELKDRGLLDTIGGPTYLIDLTRSVSSAANIGYHAQIVIDKALKRTTILSCNNAIKEGYDSQADPYTTIDNLQASLDQLVIKNAARQATQINDQIKEVFEKSADAYNKFLKTGKRITGIPSGTDLDEFTFGWQPGDLIILAARPSMGKTAFVLHCLKHAAITEIPNIPVGLFSLEMSKMSLVRRVIADATQFNSTFLRSGNYRSETELSALVNKASKLLFNAPIFIDDTPAITITQFKAKARQLVRNEGVKLLAVDYLQLMAAESNSKSGNREQEIAEISRGLKSVARELEVPVIALSQLSRAVEQRGGDKIPQLSDLRESGSIEQDADLVMFLWRPEYYGLNDKEGRPYPSTYLDVIIAKQRDGPLATVNTYFDKSTGSIKKSAHSWQQPTPDYPPPNITQPYKD